MKNILIIRLSAIGDVVMCSGLIPALKHQYKGAKISWLVEPAASAMLRENSDLDQLIIWPKQEWKELWRDGEYRQLWKRIRNFRQQLREYKFDIVLDAQGILKSGFFAWLSGAKVRIGLSSKEPSWLFHTKTLDKKSDDPNICSEYRMLAEALGCRSDSFKMSIPYGDSTRSSAINKKYNLGVNGDFAVICPFTTRPQKHWFDEHWIALVVLLWNKYQLPIIILGGPDDRIHGDRLSASSDGRVINMAGETSLLEAVVLIDHAKFLIGVDTGLTHVGIAKSTPTLALFGSTRPYLNTGSTKAKVLYKNLSCAPCRRSPSCGGSFDCMKQIIPSEVEKSLEDMLL